MKKPCGMGRLAAVIAIALISYLAGCGAELNAPQNSNSAAAIKFNPEQRLGDIERNPSTPFLRYRADGR
ncbi:MAG TPA: hypothetical protein VGA27_12875, partial [Candidatus Binatia bacterium]